MEVPEVIAVVVWDINTLIAVLEEPEYSMESQFKIRSK